MLLEASVNRFQRLCTEHLSRSQLSSDNLIFRLTRIVTVLPPACNFFVARKGGFLKLSTECPFGWASLSEVLNPYACNAGQEDHVANIIASWTDTLLGANTGKSETPKRQKAVERQSKEHRTSINQFVTTAVAEKLSALQTAQFFVDRKARRFQSL